MTVSSQGLNDIPNEFRKYENENNIELSKISKELPPSAAPKAQEDKSSTVSSQQQNNINDTLFAILLLMLFMD